MSHDADPRWTTELRALLDHDRSHAPPFEQTLAGASQTSLRWTLRPIWAFAATGVVIALLVVSQRSGREPEQPALSEWRSPTATLLGGGLAGVTLGAWRSPTAGLAEFASVQPRSPQ
jgi:hypothetical protein